MKLWKGNKENGEDSRKEQRSDITKQVEREEGYKDCEAVGRQVLGGTRQKDSEEEGKDRTERV